MKRVSPHKIRNAAEILSSSSEYIDAIYEDAQKLSERNLPIVYTLNHLAKLSDVPFSALRNVVQRKGEHYFRFRRPKKTGGYRHLSKPCDFLYKTQLAIKSEILDSDFAAKIIHPAVYSYRKGISIAMNSEKHIGAKWLIKIDIQDFFGSINEYHVFNMFKDFGYSRLFSFEIARILTWPTVTSYSNLGICNSKYAIYNNYNSSLGSIPQGAPTSPQISNIIFNALDKKVNAIAHSFGCVYTRYSDDLFFSSTNININACRDLIYKVREILYKSNFLINAKKTKIFTPNSKKIITGIVVGENNIYLDKIFKDNIKKDVFYAEKNGIIAQAKHAGSKSTLNFVEWLMGRINFAAQVEPIFANKWKIRLQQLIHNSGFLL